MLLCFVRLMLWKFKIMEIIKSCKFGSKMQSCTTRPKQNDTRKKALKFLEMLIIPIETFKTLSSGVYICCFGVTL